MCGVSNIFYQTLPTYVFSNTDKEYRTQIGLQVFLWIVAFVSCTWEEIFEGGVFNWMDNLCYLIDYRTCSNMLENMLENIFEPVLLFLLLFDICYSIDCSHSVNNVYTFHYSRFISTHSSILQDVTRLIVCPIGCDST